MGKRFVVFSMGRTGSTLLASLLNSHPQILCDGEVFTPVRWTPGLRFLARFWQRHPFPYLAYRQARMMVLHQKTIYGFKLHTKPQGAQLADVGGFLRSAVRTGWKVIHLQRRSLFDQVISSMVANQTGRYFGDESRDEAPVSLSISATRFDRVLQKSYRASEFNRTVLAGLPCVALTYEDDLADPASWEATVTRICNDLEIQPAPITRSGVEKPWRRPYCEIVTNYAELLSLYHEWIAKEDGERCPSN